MQNATTPEPTRTEPEPDAPKDRVADSGAPQQPPLKLDAEEVEERLLPLYW